MKRGDLVVRKSYGGDVIFKIESINSNMAVLKGMDFRLLADSPVTDLALIYDVQTHRGYVQSQKRVEQSTKQMEQFRAQQLEQHESYRGTKRREHAYFEVPGKVLHLDGDPSYLRKSMALYGHLRVPAEGYYVAEMNMPEAVHRLLPQVRPDILVITGHDGLLKQRKEEGFMSLNSYKNSMNFVNAVKTARQYERNRDTLTVIAGACQSHFEALLQAGANFASSPARILIHALDPVYIASKVSYIPTKETINIFDVLSNTITGLEGLGGIETTGSYRVGIPWISNT